MNKMNQRQRVLAYIKKFGSISSMEAFQDLGTTRLSAVIFDLRKKGYPIASRTEKVKNRFGETVYFSRYFMLEDENGK